MPTVKRGQLVSTVEFQLQVGTTMIRETVRLFRHSACLDFLCEIEWAQNERRLRVLFPADVPGKEVTSEIQHGFFSRPTHENTSWDEARFEYCMQRYADRSDDRGGVALLNDGKYGFRFFDGAYDVALLRSEKAIDISGDSGTHRFTLVTIRIRRFRRFDPVGCRGGASQTVRRSFFLDTGRTIAFRSHSPGEAFIWKHAKRKNPKTFPAVKEQAGADVNTQNQAARSEDATVFV